VADEQPGPPGAVLFCYDGSDRAKAAIAEAGRQLAPSRSAIVLTVWEPFASFGFGRVPVEPGAGADEELEREAELVAAEGAEAAREAGFDAQPLVERGAPVWQRLVEIAGERDVGLVVLGSHGRSGLKYVFLGSVATAVSQHAGRPVMIVFGEG
jgi:nucleotide-binding universal stress UspA family protein